jgi:hypothetical protein
MGDYNLFTILKSYIKNLLFLIGGSDGNLYWWDRIRNRSPLKVLSWDETISNESGTDVYFIKFDIENLGNESNSLEKFISLRGFTETNNEFLCNFDIKNPDRNLPPHTPRSCQAFLHDGVKPADLLSSWFKRYTIVPTRGQSKKIYIRSADLIPLSYLRYEYERFMANWFNRRHEY